MANPYSQQSSAYRHPDPKISGAGGGGGGGYPNSQRGPPRQHTQYDRDGYPAPPGAPADGHYDPSYFPPPPRSNVSFDDRTHASTERGVDDGNALTPYDEEKAYAQYSDAYGAPDYGQSRPPPAQSEYSRTTYDDRSRYGGRDRSRSRSRSRRRRPPPPSTYDSYDSTDYQDSLTTHGRRPSPSPARTGRSTPPKGAGKDILRSGDGDRGFGATLLGGAAGAFLGDHAGKGAGKGTEGVLRTLGGAVIGAIGANAAERQWEKRQQKEREKKEGKPAVDKRRSRDDYSVGGTETEYGGRGGSRVDEFRPRREGRRRADSRDDYMSNY